MTVLENITLLAVLILAGGIALVIHEVVKRWFDERAIKLQTALALAQKDGESAERQKKIEADLKVVLDEQIRIKNAMSVGRGR